MRFYGKVGFVETQKTAPGVYTETVIAEKYYYGDILNWSPREEESNDQANDELNVSNRISIMGNRFAYSHISAIKYIEWLGSRWRIRNATVNYPRIVLDIGGLYKGKEAGDDDSPKYED